MCLSRQFTRLDFLRSTLARSLSRPLPALPRQRQLHNLESRVRVILWNIITYIVMGKRGKKARAGKFTRKEIAKRLDTLVEKFEEELKSGNLFAPLPSTEVCPVCLLFLSRIPNQSVYHPCCGNFICLACVKERDGFIETQNDICDTCPFCREAKPSAEGGLRQLEARIQQNDVNALAGVGDYLWNGKQGMSKDKLKALDYWIRAAELGSAEACGVIVLLCERDAAVAAMDKKRAFIFEQVGAMRGNILSRNSIGVKEYSRGNHEVGIRHWKIAAEAGHQFSLDALKGIFLADGRMPGKEFLSKKSLDDALRVCHEAQAAVYSEERAKHSCHLYLDGFRC